MASSDISDSIPFKSWVHPKFLEIRIYVSLTRKFEGVGVKVGSFKDLEMLHVTCSQRICNSMASCDIPMYEICFDVMPVSFPLTNFETKVLQHFRVTPSTFKKSLK
ncbi:hypothetical protein QL285_062071 [Trifolium repens]|jgi:hypothetical protein|nr:hypothetical protein QL285_062071 [Trifolium repens]